MAKKIVCTCDAENVRKEMEKIKEEIISLSLSSSRTKDLFAKYEALSTIVKSISINKLIAPAIVVSPEDGYDPEIFKIVQDYVKTLNEKGLK
jgi:hypothetical protein